MRAHKKFAARLFIIRVSSARFERDECAGINTANVVVHAVVRELKLSELEEGLTVLVVAIIRQPLD